MLPDPLNPWPNVREPENLSKLVLEHSRVIICMRVVLERREVCKVGCRQDTETRSPATDVVSARKKEERKKAELVIRQVHELLSTVAHFGSEGVLKVVAHCSKIVVTFRDRREVAKLGARLTI